MCSDEWASAVSRQIPVASVGFVCLGLPQACDTLHLVTYGSNRIAFVVLDAKINIVNCADCQCQLVVR